MGKSTLLAYLALLFANRASLQGFTPEPHSIPLFISLRDFVRVADQIVLELVEQGLGEVTIPHRRAGLQ